MYLKYLTGEVGWYHIGETKIHLKWFLCVPFLNLSRAINEKNNYDEKLYQNEEFSL